MVYLLLQTVIYVMCIAWARAIIIVSIIPNVYFKVWFVFETFHKFTNVCDD